MTDVNETTTGTPKAPVKGPRATNGSQRPPEVPTHGPLPTTPMVGSPLAFMRRFA